MSDKVARSCLTVLLIGAVSIGCSETSQTAAGSPAATLEPWRTNWETFSRAIDDYRKTAKEFPQATFDSLAKGQPVPDTWAVMKAFAGEVVFEGTLKGFDAKNVIDGMPFKLELDFPGESSIAWKHIYPRAQSLDAWKAIQPGASVKFRATISGIAGMNPMKDLFAYMVLLQDAEPMK